MENLVEWAHLGQEEILEKMEGWECKVHQDYLDQMDHEGPPDLVDLEVFRAYLGHLEIQGHQERM